jgi:pyruvate dehydrogenase E2 component (dihydrolipoamide acetyltransferase)/2-oxoglutarate dehydrogenase E2 component (dihydrolipoamide succinyltransferase)
MATETPQSETVDGKRVKYIVPLKGMRAAIAEHLHRSLSESAQLTAMGEIDMTESIRLRKEFLAREQAVGARITYNDIFVFVAAKALREKPMINSSIIGNEIKVWDDINIGVAVALEEGLIVPVIRNADRKSISEISKATKALVDRAKAGTLAPDDVTGGTFTITNLGAAGAGWRFETSIINPPESAILGTGGITDRAVVRDGQIVIRPIMTYGFTYDHRVIDGATAVQFMAKVIELLENPGLLVL